ncbi:MAG: complex I subunit 5 family protein, partial [Thiobacillus sp.]
MDALIVASLATPLLVAGLLWFPLSRALGLGLAPWAPLPALLLALIAPVSLQFDLPWLLLGTRLGLDDIGRVFLLFTALIWLAAGWFARAWLAHDERCHVFAGFFLLAQMGNLGVCLALDAVSFYGFFALMSFAAYGLIVHDRSSAALHAGRVYLVLALAGEMLILTGLLLVTDATHMPVAVACLILGFGVKTGLPLLHVSLPLAYAVTPAPGAAVLAGAMIKAGVLGWLRFLPLGEAALPGAGSALMLAGLLAIFYGIALGLTQRQPGALLAYSSISQMGYFSLALGAGLLAPERWPLLLPVVVLYALHHALAKATLFLGVGVAERHGASRRVMLGLALPALALAGAPFTSGMLVKG